MNITIDTDRFDALQIRLLEEIIRVARDGLRDAGVTDEDKLHEATGNLAFAIACVVDGSTVMDLDGDPVLPVLTFAGERHGSDLVGAEGGSWMHEYAFGLLDDVFAGDDDTDGVIPSP